jgi:hypothetical protein
MQFNSQRYWLIGGEACSLCEDADKLLAQTLDEAQLAQVAYVDVKSSAELYHHFAVKIPVLYDTKANRFMVWPFGTDDIKRFIKK